VTTPALLIFKPDAAYRRAVRAGIWKWLQDGVYGSNNHGSLIYMGCLYGVAIGGLFAGESMFHRATDASKVALMALVELLADEHAQQRLVDVQWQTPHLRSLGVVEIGRAGYLGRLAQALAVPLPACLRAAGRRS